MGKWTQGQLESHDRVRERAADGHVHTVKWTQTPRDVKIQSMREKNSFRERKNRERKPIKVQQILKPEGPAEEPSGEQWEDG